MSARERPAQNLGHFAIECDDVERAKAFYEAVFGWIIKPWGPPNYYHITTGTPEHPGILGDLRERPHKLGQGQPSVGGYVCTIDVASIKNVLAAAEEQGGKLHSPPYLIEGVGTVAYIEDSERNRVGLMEPAAGRTMPEHVQAP